MTCVTTDERVAPLLELRGYGVAFGERVVLGSVDLDVPERGVTVLIGPAGVGKSTLLRTLAGANDPNPWLRTWGRATFAGAPLGAGEAPALLAQNARLLTGTVFENLVSALPNRSSLERAQQIEIARRLLAQADLDALSGALSERVLDLPVGLQRRLAVARTTAAEPRLLFADEPTSNLDPAEADAMIALLRREGERRAVLLVTHNLLHARAVGDAVALLAGGRVLEARPAADFFAGPSTEAGRHFLSSGSCSVPSPGTPAEDLAEGVEPTPVPLQATEPIRNARGPRGFRWMKRGRLAGTPRPGLIDDFEADLEALRSVGVTLLVTLETERLPDAALRAAGLRSLFFPVEDMRAPSIEAARAHCEEIARLEAAGEVIAVHCRAGLGRTGTMLAAQLVHEGASALEAIEAVRRVEAQWIQSEAQIVFLERFAEALRAVR